MLVVVLAAGGFLGWQVWGTDARARTRAGQEVASMRANWAAVPSTVGASTPGAPIGVISIPKLGLAWPVVVGTDEDALQRGVGWYRTTAWPGDVGNTAMAGLRVTHGSPFRGLLDLVEGDEVVVETARATLRYEVVVPASQLTVDKDAGWVLDPVPGHPGAPPHQPLLTLTTAQDLVATGERSVAIATLASRTDR